MNRNDEFNDFMKELDAGVPEIGESIKKGRRRKARKQFLYQPLMGMAAVFLMFVLSVNLCAPVAKAFSNVPLLKELTKAVTFSESLRDAIENDYVQDVYMKQTKDGVTVEIVSVIVDQDKLSVFYRFASKKYEGLQANCTVLDEKGEDTLGYTPYESSDFDRPNEEIRCISTDMLTVNMTDGIFMDAMPEKVRFHMVVWDRDASEKEFLVKGFSGGNYVYSQKKEAEKYYITEFDFALDLDPDNLPKPISYEVNQTMEIEGQKLTVTDVLVYPTFMRVNVKESLENTMSLSFMNFYVETETGERFYNFLGGFSSNPVEKDIPRFHYFDTESTYFTNAESLKLVVTSVDWKEPGKERTYVNISTGEVSGLPEYVTMEKIVRMDETIYLRFKQQYVGMEDSRSGEVIQRRISAEPFTQNYFVEDEEYRATYSGESDKETEWTAVYSGLPEWDENQKIADICEFEFCLKGYPYEEIWLENWYSESWRGEEEVVVVIK